MDYYFYIVEYFVEEVMVGRASGVYGSDSNPEDAFDQLTTTLRWNREGRVFISEFKRI